MARLRKGSTLTRYIIDCTHRTLLHWFHVLHLEPTTYLMNQRWSLKYRSPVARRLFTYYTYTPLYNLPTAEHSIPNSDGLFHAQPPCYYPLPPPPLSPKPSPHPTDPGRSVTSGWNHWECCNCKRAFVYPRNESSTYHWVCDACDKWAQ